MFYRLTIKPLYFVSGHSSFKKIAGPLACANFTWEENLQQQILLFVRLTVCY